MAKTAKKRPAKRSATAAAAGKRTFSKVKARSLHIGLNAVSPLHYQGWSGELVACEADANDMAALARLSGIRSQTLLTRKATRASTLAALRAASSELKSGDLFFLTYSGHGGQVPDVTGEEDDKQDETWCLFDGQVIDDELYLELTRFAEGVRILVFSDSCHSGTVTRAAPPNQTTTTIEGGRSKMMPPSVALRTYGAHRAFYDKIQRAVAAESDKKKETVDPDAALANVAVSNRLTSIAGACKASVILISGCQDNQTSMDGAHNGAFTEQLLQVWNHGRYKGTYAKFHAAIKARMPATQSPNLFPLGPSARFLTQQPFSV